MTQPFIISVILNTNRREDTLECLASLSRSTYSNQKVIVLDNQSIDGSVEAIKSAFPSVEIVKLEENLGFGGNNNIGIKYALDQGADWVFILNEDTILDPECISHLLAVGESDSRIGILGPMIYDYDEPGIIQSAGGKIEKYWQAFHLAENSQDTGMYTEPYCVDWINGCSIFIQRSVIEQIGMIDERYFYYWDETEWCLRAKKNGWQIVQVPRAKLWHKGMQRNTQPKPAATYYATRNRLLTLAKHHAPLAAWVYTWGQLLRILASWTIRPKWRTKREHRDAMWRGMVDFLFRRWGQMPS